MSDTDRETDDTGSDGGSLSGPDESIESSTSNIGPDFESEQAQSYGKKIAHTAFLWLRDGSLGLVFVAIVFAVLAATAGVWPPLMVVESGSMSPNLNQGDIVVVSEPDRFSSSAADKHGIVTYDVGKEAGMTSFGNYGSVIVFGGANETVSANQGTIHRSMFTVDEGENWYNRSNPDYLGDAENCNQLRNCPAPNSGYITKGDNNERYDQAIGFSPPVKPGWVAATPEVRVPYVGYIRLISDFLGF
jgi:signal peptidase